MGCHHAAEVATAVIPWDIAAPFMKQARFNDPLVSVEYYHDLYQRRLIECYGVFVNNQLSGVFLAEVHTTINGSDFHVLQAIGCDPSFSVLEAGIRAFDELARARGCMTVTFETVRPGMVKRAQEYGYAPHEVVMRKAIG